MESIPHDTIVYRLKTISAVAILLEKGDRFLLCLRIAGCRGVMRVARTDYPL